MDDQDEKIMTKAVASLIRYGLLKCNRQGAEIKRFEVLKGRNIPFVNPRRQYAL